MAKQNLTELSTEQLRGKLKAVQSILWTVAGIFTLIVAVWVVLGYWRTNLPVFITTLTMAVTLPLVIFASMGGIKAELKRREQSVGGENVAKSD